MAKAKKKKKPTTKAATKGPKAKKAPKPKKTATAKKKKIGHVPKGYTSVSPVMCLDDAAATIEFCKTVFRAKPRMVMPGPGDKIMHAEIEIGDAVIMLTDAVYEPARVSSIFLYVPDVDATIAKAVEAGAKVIMPAADMFWGDRFGRVVDPAGNFWGIGTHVEDVSPAEMKKRAKASMEQMPPSA